MHPCGSSRPRRWSALCLSLIHIYLCQYVDVCISNEEDAKDVFGIEAESTDIYAGEINREGYKSVAKQLADKFGFEKVAINSPKVTTFMVNSF